MKALFLGAAAFALAIPTSSVVMAQPSERGGGKPDKAGPGKNGGPSAERGNGGMGKGPGGKPDRGPDMRGNGQGNGNALRGQPEGKPDKGPPARFDPAPGIARGNGPDAKGIAKDIAKDMKRGAPPARGGAPASARSFFKDDFRDVADYRDFARGTYYVRDDGRLRFGDRYDGYYLADCPPGLAKKHNGCQPPGQAKKFDRGGGLFGSFFGRDPRFAGGDYYYANGYAYRLEDGLARAILPLIGGALFRGNVWPSAYDSYRVPTYYDDFYGYDPAYDYRFADNAIFSVDPKDQAIMGIAGLLTGNNFVVGQPAPRGYDVYNVPYGYRDRYVDGPGARYRYSDGYVYEIDPATMLVASAIKLAI